MGTTASLGAANGSSATVAAVTLGPPPQLVLFGETSSVPPFLLLVLRRPRPLGLGLTILFAPGGISFTFINEAGRHGSQAGSAFLHALEAERRRHGGGLMKLFPQDHMVARPGFVPRF